MKIRILRRYRQIDTSQRYQREYEPDVLQVKKETKHTEFGSLTHQWQDVPIEEVEIE